MLKWMVQLFICVFLFGVCTPAMAEDHCDLQLVSAGPGTAWTAPLCGKGKLVVQPFAFYNRTRGTFDAAGHSDALPKGDKKSQYLQQLFVQYGLTDKLELAGQIVYQENYIKQDGVRAHDRGLGDSSLFTRYCFGEEKSWYPQVSGLLQVKIPTGRYQHLDPDKMGVDNMGAGTGGGSWDPGAGVILTKTLAPFILHADVIYSVPQKVRVDGVKTVYGEYVNYDAAVEYFLPKGFNLLVELNGLLQKDIKQDGVRSPGSDIQSLTLSPGIGWSNQRIQTLIAYQRVVAGVNTDANDSVLATFVYTF